MFMKHVLYETYMFHLNKVKHRTKLKKRES